ncbi:MAG: HAMP domain-containing histidine kinase [Chloroflexi bacterium]|nr:HAMP domain-containing histidine kinase [Chloroflexota bacterium]
MSIRLRLTLLFTAILALTLAGFGAMLYGTQSRSMRGGDERILAETARRIVERWSFEGDQFGDRPFGERPFSPGPPNDEGTSDRAFGGRAMYIQLVSLEGQVINHSENLEEVILPLSDDGWHAVESGEPWVEIALVEGERLFIHSEPIFTEQQVTSVIQVARSLADQDQYLNTLRRNLFVGSGVAIIIAFGAGWILSGLVLRPVNRITQTARAIGAERDFDRRVQHTGPNDEIGQLATTFNVMLTELQAAYQQQRQFVADVSHELRTPLTTLRGNLALLRRKPSISADDRVDVLDDMADESDRLVRLVNDLLTLARAESGRALRNDPVRVKPLIENVCGQARLLAADRTITCDSLADVAVVGDHDALKQVLLSLVDNALKHTAGPITVTANLDGPETRGSGKPLVSIRVQDSGPGIDPKALLHIFERFYRGKEARTRPGIGLGLPIAKALIEAHNGTISVESQVERGSVITVTLPQAAARR